MDKIITLPSGGALRKISDGAEGYIEARDRGAEIKGHASKLNDAQLRKAAVLAEARRMPGVGDPSPDRKRELGEVQVELGNATHRIRVSYDPNGSVEGGGAMILHSVVVALADIGPSAANAFTSIADRLDAVQGQEAHAQQAELLGALIERVLRRNEFAARALVAHLNNLRF